ncbi:MAG: asparaginase [Bacteroidales bacterium]
MSEILIEVTRGEVVERIHRGDIAIVDLKGRLLHYVGEASKYTYMRSAAKPLQAMNIILSGAAQRFNFTNEELAIMCASHYAEADHLRVVRQILDKINLGEEDLLTGKSGPLSKKIAFEYAWRNMKDNALFNDCSGKHAGVLAVCRHNNYSLKNYISENHPANREILEIISEMTHYQKNKITIGIDGCSLPVHAMPLYNMAQGFANLTDPKYMNNDLQMAANKIFDAMVENPFMIAGTDGFCTDLIHSTEGKLIGKIGAEGVYCVGIKDKGMGIAVKIEDGLIDVLPPVVMKVLEEIEVLNNDEIEALGKYRVMNNYNDVKTIVGQIKPAFQIRPNVTI